MSLEDRLRSHYESLSRAISFTRVADAKAAPVLALHIALLGTLATQAERLLAFESATLTTLLFLYAALVLLSMFLGANVYIPRHPRSDGSLIYFEDIASLPIESFIQRAKEVDLDCIERQLLEQIHAVSSIASVKMRRVRWAYYVSGPSVVLWVVLFGWGSI